MNTKKEKKFLMFFFIFIFLSILLKIQISKVSYSLITKYHFDSFLLDENLDERIAKLMLLKKNNNDFDTYFFGSSTTTVFYPKELKKLNINSFNTSFSGGSVSEHLAYLNWILKNKKKPKRLFIELRDHSLLDFEFNVTTPPDLLSFFLKAKFYFTELFSIKFIIKNFINFDQIFFKIKNKIKFNLNKYTPFYFEIKMITNENIKKKREYVLAGTRYYQSYFEIKNNSELENLKNEKILKSEFIFINKKIDHKKMSDLKKIVEKCNFYNIDCKFFFGPVYKDLLFKNNSQYLTRELFIIEQILKKEILDKIYYFNNNEYSQNVKNFINDQLHYNYEIAYNITEELLLNDNKSTKTLTILTNYNFEDYKKNINLPHEKN